MIVVQQHRFHGASFNVLGQAHPGLGERQPQRLILIIFGPSKLGDVGGALGKAIRDFKKAMNEPENPNPSKPTQVEAKSTEPKA